ncbi:uncharacterized protein LOC135384259 [Ornithodoros turicata]|uniref:uncharacterized protein LOC135384259 n=1 Tax=Ornithodoros turicata TaxID=34597 RepID=UPI003139BF23
MAGKDTGEHFAIQEGDNSDIAAAAPSVDEQGAKPKRRVALSQKAQQNYELERDEHRAKLDKAWEETALELEKICIPEASYQEVGRLSTSYKRYKLHAERFSSFLTKTNVEQSLTERDVQKAIDMDRDDLVRGIITEIEHRLDGQRETGSRRSDGSVHSSLSSRRSTHSSLDSSVSSAATKARADAEAARALTSYSQQETAMKLEKARIEANLEALQREKEAAVAEAQAKVLEAALEQYDPRLTEVKFVDTSERTREYVLRHGVPQSTHAFTGDSHRCHTVSGEQTAAAAPGASQGDNVSRAAGGRLSGRRTIGLGGESEPTTLQNPLPIMGDVARYLLRRELVTTGLSKFSDRPEDYRSWKSAFRNATKDLGISATEEMDLLVRWLGTESSVYARRLRAVHIGNPDMGLQAIWERLEEAYGSPEAIENALIDRLERFPRILGNDREKLRELGDLLQELESAKADPHLPGLSYLDTSRGVNPIAAKLPLHLQEKWIALGSKYKREHRVSFPPFSVFSDFVRTTAKTKNDPSFIIGPSSDNTGKKDKTSSTTQSSKKSSVSVHRTTITSQEDSSASQVERTPKNPEGMCPLHKKPHILSKCRAFRRKPLAERKRLLSEFGACFKCCAMTHNAKSCDSTIHCTECNSDHHITAFHPENVTSQARRTAGVPSAEEDGFSRASAKVTSSCTEVCGDANSRVSCSKICLVKVYPEAQPEQAVRMYAVIDDQSNKSLARPEFFECFNIHGCEYPYTLRTCAGVVETLGRRATGYVVEGIDSGTRLPLPTLTECDQIPNDRNEIPTPDVARRHPHLKALADVIPPLDPNAQILLLLGRDLVQAHKVRQQRNGPNHAPFAQKLDLGWVIVGDVCIERLRTPQVCTFATTVLQNGRPSYFTPCPNHMIVKEKPCFEHSAKEVVQSPPPLSNDLTDPLFQITRDDEKLAPSMEDKEFLSLMDGEFHRDTLNNWVAPLHFRMPRRELPDNREQAFSRFASLRRTLERNAEMKRHFVAFMQDMLENGHAEQAPPRKEANEYWYLPSFGIYHPQKPGQIRVVFDSSTKYQGVSLNDLLLSGSDMTNSLIGVLLRFRKEAVAVTADIQRMFYSFFVREEDRDYLRFLWFRDNDTSKDVIEYRMCVHAFGNTCSPAIATYGLRRTAQEGEQDFGADVRHFIERDFYVDDGLKSLPTEEESIDLLKRTQHMLKGANLRLHKIASNSVEVMGAFPSDDYARGLKDMDFDRGHVPMQRSLGLNWDLKGDTFTFKVPVKDTPNTRRGVLSTVNSLYDPLGFTAPVTVQGRLLLRDISSETSDWDAPLDLNDNWLTWRDSLHHLERLKIPRQYTAISLSDARRREICVFCDASEKAIAAVAYIRVTDADGMQHVGFVFGKAKLAPRPEQTIPRLELCAAVLAVDIAELVVSEIDAHIDDIKFYTDSKVVLGYIFNQSRRFYVYVSNRVNRIRRSTKPEQWHYVPTGQNPADHATRPVAADALAGTTWLTGPKFLRECTDAQRERTAFPLFEPDQDKEIRPQVSVSATRVGNQQLGAHRFERFSTWTSLLRAVACLVHIARSFHNPLADCHGWHYCSKPRSADELNEAKKVILRCVQHEEFPEAVTCPRADAAQQSRISSSNPLCELDPFVDNQGLLRVGGRLRNSDLDEAEKHPVIVPGRHHVGLLLIRHYHGKVKHQGRHFTEGAIRAAGFWIIGGKRCIGAMIHHCITCRKLRRKLEHQKMADLPEDRLSADPPFTCVGLDVFGPWMVASRRTRGGLAHNKRWAVLFTCMAIRAVHIEVIESMDTSSFINALRRFLALRGPVKQLRSDRGTNFVGACSELKMSAVGFELRKVQRFLSEQGCTWIFNTPHSSHMGGVWERMIGMARRILDSMLLNDGSPRFSHEVLTTFLAEVTVIINGRPLVPVSSDPECPSVLSPAMILTQKPTSSTAPPGDFKSLHVKQWKQVQALANSFWHRWRTQFLPTLQRRRKWKTDRPNLQVGDLVLLKDVGARRNEWPMGRITAVRRGNDGKVRKVQLQTVKDGKKKTFERPVSEMVLLFSPDQSD